MRKKMGHVVFFYHMNLHVPLRMRAKIDYKRGRFQSLYPGADIGVNLGAMSQPWKNSLLFPRERFCDPSPPPINFVHRAQRRSNAQCPAS